ncbi:MAG: type II secretion system F family protein [Rhodocyclaceae bacterium]|nr:type II secretion system F family protein [Rhodocyclaceae bacterium]
MNLPQLLLAVSLSSLFCAVALLTLSAVLYWRDRRLGARLAQLGGRGPVARPGGAGLKHASGRLAQMIETLSRLSAPDRALHQSSLRLRLAAAGWRGERAPLLFYAARTACTLALPLIAALLLSSFAASQPPAVLALAVATLAVSGYMAPEVWLRVRTQRRREQIRAALPDMVDLLLVCVESGLALDAAINRVAREIAARSPALAEEFHLAALEIRAGARRVDALHNLAARCGVDEVNSLVAMLVQSERFGTGLGDALRVQADFMRVRRTQRAEELAAKVPLKVLFPLILLIFPSLLVVILGPAMIRLPQILGGQ